MNAPRWFVTVDGAPPRGPFTKQQLGDDLAAGKIPGNAKVAEEGASDWQGIGDVVGSHNSGSRFDKAYTGTEAKFVSEPQLEVGKKSGFGGLRKLGVVHVVFGAAWLIFAGVEYIISGGDSALAVMLATSIALLVAGVGLVRQAKWGPIASHAWAALVLVVVIGYWLYFIDTFHKVAELSARHASSPDDMALTFVMERFMNTFWTLAWAILLIYPILSIRIVVRAAKR